MLSPKSLFLLAVAFLLTFPAAASMEIPEDVNTVTLTFDLLKRRVSFTPSRD